MIKIYDTFPTEKPLQKALHWQKDNFFPLYDLISNGTINIDTAFKVDKMIYSPRFVSLGSSIYRPTAANKDLFTMSYIGQLDDTVKANGIGRLTSVDPPFMYEGEFNSDGQPNGFGRFISESTLVQGRWDDGQISGSATMI